MRHIAPLSARRAASVQGMASLHPPNRPSIPAHAPREVVSSITAPLCLAALLAAGCTESYSFANVAPLIDAIGPICVDGEGHVWVLVSLVDYESDPVDLMVEWRAGSGAFQPAVMRVPPAGETVEENPICDTKELDKRWSFLSGFGSQGLATENEPPGALHVLVLDASTWEAAQGSELVIRLTPDDRQGKPGAAFESAAFRLDTGSATVVVP